MFAILLIIIIFLFVLKSVVKPINYPPGPIWLPVVGCAFSINKIVAKHKNLHLALNELADFHKTNVLGLKLGQEKVVVVFKDLSIKVLMNQSFDGRPDNFFIRLRTMGQRKGITGVDGPLWEEQRHFILKNLRDHGYGKSCMDNYILQELNDILEEIGDRKKSVDMANLLSPSILNILWIFLAGTSLGRSNHRIGSLLHLMRRRTTAFDISGGVLNQMPWLRFVAPVRTGYTLIKSINSELFRLFGEIINEHKTTSTNSDSLIGAYIQGINEQLSSTFTEEQLLMVCFDFFIAGSTTTSEFLNLAFLAMIVHSKVQDKVHKEIDAVIGIKTISVRDRKNLPYIMAVLYEISRYYSIMNIIGPRRTMKDIDLGGYSIPKHTTVLINIKSLHDDADRWTDPDKFMPERFLNEKHELINGDNIMTFGLGRRRCLGETLAKNCIFLFFCGILQKFVVTPADGLIPSDTLQNGILSKAPPYHINFIRKNNENTTSV